jgi:hypothetical protein
MSYQCLGHLIYISSVNPLNSSFGGEKLEAKKEPIHSLTSDFSIIVLGQHSSFLLHFSEPRLPQMKSATDYSILWNVLLAEM